MHPSVRNLFDLHRLHAFKRTQPLILVNGLAEQSMSWFANRRPWGQHFDVKVPELLVYDGAPLHRHVDAGGEVTIDYLTDRLAQYLDEFVQRPPYNLVSVPALGARLSRPTRSGTPRRYRKSSSSARRDFMAMRISR